MASDTIEIQDTAPVGVVAAQVVESVARAAS